MATYLFNSSFRKENTNLVFFFVISLFSLHISLPVPLVVLLIFYLKITKSKIKVKRKEETNREHWKRKQKHENYIVEPEKKEKKTTKVAVK